jgi:SpoVK/Ycf46/Vps4 family AAA+-type ATPase
VLATSNFKEAIDPAFLSRVDIHFEAGRPGLSATYRIMTEVVEELVRLQFIEQVPVQH